MAEQAQLQGRMLMIIKLFTDERLTASGVWISSVSLDTSALALMVDWRPKGKWTTGVSDTRISAGTVRRFTVLGGGTVRVNSTLRLWKKIQECFDDSNHLKEN